MHKFIVAVLLVLLIILQYKYWIGEGGMLELGRFNQAIEDQKLENSVLADRNRLLDAQIIDLKSSMSMVEEQARSDLGMVKKGETFYQIVE